MPNIGKILNVHPPTYNIQNEFEEIKKEVEKTEEIEELTSSQEIEILKNRVKSAELVYQDQLKLLQVAESKHKETKSKRKDLENVLINAGFDLDLAETLLNKKKSLK